MSHSSCPRLSSNTRDLFHNLSNNSVFSIPVFWFHVNFIGLGHCSRSRVAVPTANFQAMTARQCGVCLQLYSCAECMYCTNLSELYTLYKWEQLPKQVLQSSVISFCSLLTLAACPILQWRHGIFVVGFFTQAPANIVSISTAS
jgi:hypothetical protein